MKVFTKEITIKRIISLFFVLVILFCCLFSGCKDQDDLVTDNDLTILDGFCVNFIDVGNGDCIFIRFADGKNMMIDCGERSTRNFKAIKRVVDAYSNGTINYLVLTHPDVDHVGNATQIINTYTVEKAFIPNIYNLEDYFTFKQTKELLEQKSVETQFSSEYVSIKGQDYLVAFLSPLSTQAGGYYGEFNSNAQPSDTDVNNLSPIIYLEYKGVRFLFTGDAGKAQESLLIDAVQNDFPSVTHKTTINLYDIDVLKVSHHGAEDGSSKEFLQILKPRYAVLSVGSDNVYGHPSSLTINRLYEANNQVGILRTDLSGTISIGVDTQGNTTIAKQSE